MSQKTLERLEILRKKFIVAHMTVSSSEIWHTFQAKQWNEEILGEQCAPKGASTVRRRGVGVPKSGPGPLPDLLIGLSTSASSVAKRLP